MLYQAPLPPASTWELFPNLAVIILIMGVLFGGLMAIWREYKAWQREQDKAAAGEQAEHRQWQERQDETRDERWQGFLAQMQRVFALESEANREQIGVMAENIRKLSENSQKLTETVGHLSDTLTTHIAVDDARFDVLLSPAQKQAMKEQTGPPSGPRRPRKAPL